MQILLSYLPHNVDYVEVCCDFITGCANLFGGQPVFCPSKAAKSVKKVTNMASVSEEEPIE